MKTYSRWLGLAAALMLPLGCWGGGAAQDGAEGGTGEGESGDGDGDGDGDACTEWADDEAGTEVALTITNTTDAPIFVVGNLPCVIAYLEVHQADSYWPPHDCDPSCAGLMDGGCACPEGCAQVPAIRLEPDSSFVQPWPSLIRVADELPAACGTDFCPAGACSVATEAGEGTYDLAAFVATTVAACDPDSGDPMLCACTPNADGWCELYLQPDPGEILGLGTTFEMPTEAVELLVD